MQNPVSRLTSLRLVRLAASVTGFGPVSPVGCPCLADGALLLEPS